VLAHLREAAVGVLRRGVGRVVEVERRPVVDQPEPPVPPEEVRVADGAVDVRHEGVEPDDVSGEVGIR
jgi:hypothetical protein